MQKALLSKHTQAFLRALASPTRQALLMQLAGGETLTVGQIAEQCKIGQSTASEQLALLRQGGLVAASRAGKQRLYYADAASIRAQLNLLIEALEQCCPPSSKR
ncbi:MAG: metalloregulator ArsR/SmtB family transcription factor [Burkholderiaceae bacterium]|nr:metalloregulator ArsR/SmtB family transcription factor [Burkholderiaceae bacterium]